MTSREALLSEAFVSLADTLVRDFDLQELMHRLAATCVELLDADAAGILLADAAGQLRVVGASEERLFLLELFELQNEEGPCLEAFRTGRPVSEEDLGAGGSWPRFSEQARSVGYRSVDALPLRLRYEVIGALNLFYDRPGGAGPEDLRLAQALADVATIGLIQERVIRESRLLADQLQVALNSRVVIEQAKGMLAEQGGVGVDDAFAALRGFARSRHLSLSALAERVVEGTLGYDELVTD